MNVNFQTAGTGGKSATNEWYTPPEIIHSLGKFDLDPSTSLKALAINHSAEKYYTIDDNGLIKKWTGRVWLNPPYEKVLISAFMKKLAEHGNGVALVYNRFDSTWFQKYVLDVADSIFFFRKRIQFLRPDGTKGDRSGAGSCLIAYGEHNTKAIEQSGLNGRLVLLKNDVVIKKKQTVLEFD